MAVSVMSRQAKVMSITRLVQHFDDENLSQFKQELFNCVNVTNEKQFLCKILPIIQKSLLSSESIDLLKSTVVKMAEKQKMSTSDNDINTKSSNHVTIYKFVTQRHKDRLSRVPSSIISHIASYLSKIDSLKVGYLNKQLYIESQRLSYISSSRWLRLYIYDTELDRILINVSNTYSFSVPSQLSLLRRRKLSLEPRFNSLLSSQWFNMLFTHLQVLHVDEQYFPFIPFKTLFASKNRNISSNYNKYNANKNENINIVDKITNVSNEVLDVALLVSWEQEFDSHCDRFCQEYGDCCKWVNSNDMNAYSIRKVRVLKICNPYNNGGACSTQQCRKYISKGKKIVLGLNRNYTQLCWCIPLFTISDLGELQNIFHDNLQYFQLYGFGSPSVSNYNELTKLEKEYMDKKEKKWQNNRFLCKKLKMISFATLASFIIWFLHGYEKIDLFYYVETFEIRYSQHLINGNINQTMTNIAFDPQWIPIFDRIFWARYDKNPFLKSVNILFSDDEFLHQFIAICLYLIGNKQNLSKTNIRSVTFFWTKFYKVSTDGDQEIQFQSEQAQRHEIFGYQLNHNEQNNCNDVINKSKNRTHHGTPRFHYQLKDISQKIFGMLYKSLIEEFEDKNVAVSNTHEPPKEFSIVQIDFDIVKH